MHVRVQKGLTRSQLDIGELNHTVEETPWNVRYRYLERVHNLRAVHPLFEGPALTGLTGCRRARGRRRHGGLRGRCGRRIRGSCRRRGCGRRVGRRRIATGRRCRTARDGRSDTVATRLVVAVVARIVGRRILADRPVAVRHVGRTGRRRPTTVGLAARAGRRRSQRLAVGRDLSQLGPLVTQVEREHAERLADILLRQVERQRGKVLLRVVHLDLRDHHLAGDCHS